MIHYTTLKYWQFYKRLPVQIQKIADEAFKKLKENPKHPSLHLKKIKDIWSVRAGIKYRALGVEKDSNIVWYWIGSHSDYNELIK